MSVQEARKIGRRTWVLDETGLVNAFLVEGDAKAALIDTGCGYGDIREVVASIVDKPLVVLLTHGHPDHVGGIYHFKDCPVYMNHLDKEMAFKGFKTDNAFRRMYVETRGPVRCPGREDMVLASIPSDDPDCSFEPVDVDDGSLIDLGGRVLECIHTPGHSDGSICYLDREERMLFSGDTVNKSIILMRQPGNDLALVRRYHKTLEKLWARHEDYDKLAIGHDGDVIDKSMIHDYLEITTGLLDGSLTGQYEEVGFRKGDVARCGAAELWYQCDE